MSRVVGCDEAGCGPAFGDLVAGAVHLPDDVLIPGLTDSKKLSEAKRKKIVADVYDYAHYGVGVVRHDEIDARGLAWARRDVFHRALDDFVDRNGYVPTDIVVDGDLFESWRDVPHTCVPKADQTVPCVSAASVIAKVVRDESVLALCDAHPELDERYALRSNKGYLSPAHKNGLRAHGFSQWHRMSYNVKL